MSRAAKFLSAAFVLTLAGCWSMPRARIGGIVAEAPRDVGKPAEIAVNRSVAVVPIPANSEVVMRPAATPNDPPVVAVRVSEPTEMRVETTHQSANTGTVDTTAATRRADNAARMPLLFAAIGAVGLTGLFVILKFPGPATISGASAGVFLLAWQAAGLPPWFHIIGIAGLAVAGGLYFGFNRGENAA